MKRPGQAESLKYQFPYTTRLPSSRFTEPALPVRLSALALVFMRLSDCASGPTRSETAENAEAAS